MINIKDRVRLAYTPSTLPAQILERFESGWTAIQACQAIGYVEDIESEPNRKLIVLYEEGPGPECIVYLDENDVREYDPLSADAVAADPTGRGEGHQPPLREKGADFITKIFLRDRKEPVLVSGDFDDVVRAIEQTEADDWPKFTRVGRDGMLQPDEIAINPKHVVSVQSEREFG